MKSRSGEKIKLTSIDELLGVVNEESAMEIEINRIHAFKDHPFKVLDDEKMADLVESVKTYGVLTPVLLRSDGENGYEMISGHRRMHAAAIAGLATIPAIVRELSDDDAVIAMVDANIQREELLPSEKAFAYKYIDYNLVMATTFGNPIGTGAIRGQLKKLIEEHNLPPVVFHSLRHSSVTYKLKLNGGDIKAVQGDSGHSQVDMVTDVYSHIIDEDRRRNAELFEEAFYEKKNLDPKMREETTTQTVDVPDDVDAELLAKVLANPEMKALLASLAKAMK